MEVSDAKRLKAIDDENIKLKRFLVDAILDASVRKNLLAKMMTPSAVREAVVNVLREQDVGERRACSIIGADRSAIRCRSRRSDDALLRGRPRELASERRRFSYRRLHVLLRREGHVVNHKLVQRLYREKGLSVPRRRSRKRAIGTRAPMVVKPAQMLVGRSISVTIRGRPASGSVFSMSSTM